MKKIKNLNDELDKLLAKTNLPSDYELKEETKLERLKNQSSYAASLIPNEARRRGGLKNVHSGHCNRIAHLGGKANSKSGHIQKLQPLATKAASEANKKQVIKMDKKGKIIKTYSSLIEASLDNNRTSSSISNNIAGRTKYCGGFIWKYKK